MTAPTPYTTLSCTARVDAGVPVVSFNVRAQPRSSRERVEGVVEGALRVALTAPPVDGEANAALVGFLAKALRLSKRDVTVARGATGRNKVIEVRGLSDDALRERFAALK